MISFAKDLFVGLSINALNDFNINHKQILPKTQTPNLKGLRAIYLSILEIESDYSNIKNKYPNNTKLLAFQNRIESIKLMISNLENSKE